MRTEQDMEQARFEGTDPRRPIYAKAALYPTPKAQNVNSPSNHGEGGPDLQTVIGGSLNPPWVEWLMGWPIGWTDLEPLATGKFRQWQHSHGLY